MESLQDTAVNVYGFLQLNSNNAPLLHKLHLKLRYFIFDTKKIH